MQQHTNVWQGVTYWAGGPWWGDYMFSIEPQNGVDKPQMAILMERGGGSGPVSILENTTAVTTVTATDPDTGQTLSYSISGGADAGKFIIGPSTGALSFVTAPNFEVPTDAGRQQCLRRDRPGFRRPWRHRHPGDCGHGERCR